MKKGIQVFLTLLTLLIPLVVFGSGHTKMFTTDEMRYGKVPAVIKAEVKGEFPNASIVNIEGEGKKTAAVVDSGGISFYVERHGIYKITDTGKNVASQSIQGNLESVTPGQVAYKGAGNGTLEEPLTVLADFANLSSAVKKLQVTWKGYNVYAGYDLAGTAPLNQSAVKKVLVEDRDEITGKLIGSFYLDGALWKPTQEANKGPYYMNYMLDPTDEYLTAGYALDNHYNYTENSAGGKEKMTEALVRLKAVRDSKDSVLFLQTRLRDFAGPITFKIDVSGLKKFKQGDKVAIRYLLGSSNRNVYHGTKPSAEVLLADESTYSKYYQDKGVTAVVDSEGYLTYTLYNGGYFALTKVTN